MRRFIRNLARKLRLTRRPSILLIGAHPDDITYSAGGFAAMASQLGFEVIEIIATSGQAGSQDEALWPSDAIGDIRVAEQHAANAILGISQTIFLGHQDGGLRHTSRKLTKQLRRLIKRYRPRIILTYGPDGLTGHEDHRVTSDCATQAFRQVGLPDAALWYIAATEEWNEHIRPHLDDLANAMYGPQYPFVVEHRHLVLDLKLSAKFLATKLQAVEAHFSQRDPLDSALASVGGFDALVEHWISRETYVAAY